MYNSFKIKKRNSQQPTESVCYEDVSEVRAQPVTESMSYEEIGEVIVCQENSTREQPVTESMSYEQPCEVSVPLEYSTSNSSNGTVSSSTASVESNLFQVLIKFECPNKY